MSDLKATASDEVGASQTHLPHSRIKTIMKSSADPVSLNIKEESLQLVCRATEMFIQMLAKESNRTDGGGAGGAKPLKTVDYMHLAEFVQGQTRLEFLHQIVPKKITVRQFREIMAKKKKNASDESSSSDSGSGSDEDESSSGSGSSGGAEEEPEEEEEEQNDEKPKAKSKSSKKTTTAK